MTPDLPLDSTLAVSDAVSNTLPSARPQAGPDELAGRDTIGRFAVLARLGEGGMGVVYSAYDEVLDRRVAIKVLKDGHGAGAGDTDLRMRREAQALARLSHPNVVQVYEVGAVAGQIFVAMEYIAGRTLRGWHAESDRPWQEVVAMYMQAGHGLAAAHAVGLVHRDFKPDNVLVGVDGRARVVDFGLARSADAPADDAASDAAPVAEPAHHAFDRLTRTGALVGTPRFMAPEQYLRKPATALADQFSFCAALFEALYGVTPHAGDAFYEFVQHRIDGDLVAVPADTAVPASVHRVLARGLAPAPEDRWPTMDDLLAALAADPQFATDPQQDLGVGRRPRLYIGLALGAVSVVNMAVVVTHEATRTTPGTTREALIGGTIGLVLVALTVFLVRRRAFANAINRQIVLFGLVMTAAAWVNRAIGHVLAAPLADILVGDMLIATAMSVITAAMLVGWVGWVAAVFGVGTLVGTLVPHAAPTVLAICQCVVWLLALRVLLVPGLLVVSPAAAARSRGPGHGPTGAVTRPSAAP